LDLLALPTRRSSDLLQRLERIGGRRIGTGNQERLFLLHRRGSGRRDGRGSGWGDRIVAYVVIGDGLDDDLATAWSNQPQLCGGQDRKSTRLNSSHVK